MSTKTKIQKTSLISQIVFIVALCVVLINILSLIFPAFLVTTTSGSESQVNSFEIGAWTVPFITVNLLILGFGVMYHKKILPNKIINSFKFILNFEVSRKVAIIIIVILISLYIIFTIPELGQKEIDVWKDWKFVEPFIENFPEGEGSPQIKVLYVKNFLLFTSLTVFQNVKIIPFIISVSLILATYFFTVKISQKRFAGLVAIVILLQSHTFLRYDTTATFSNDWTLFYLLSLFLIYKKWHLSPLVFLASILSKPLTAAFLPMTIFFTLRSQTSRKIKIILIISYLIILSILAIGLLVIEDSQYSKSFRNFDSDEFFRGFAAWAYQLRIDGLVLVFLLPLSVSLFLKARQGKQELDSILVIITGILLAAPLLAGFSEFNLQPYRWIPLIVFFAIGVGALLSKNHHNGMNIE